MGSCKFILVLIISVCSINFGITALSSTNFKVHFEAFSKTRNPNLNKEAWLESREYIKEKFREYGLTQIQEQMFNTSIGRKHPSSEDDEEPQMVEGMNIVAIRFGSNKNGPIIVVGADYDTPVGSNPLKNNGGGIAMLLETARLVEEAVETHPYNLTYTIIYVAFDLNTLEYRQAVDKGEPGSYYFVHEWLKSFLQMIRVEFRGAFILDSVTTYNINNNSQLDTLRRDGFDKSFPDAVDKITNDGAKGDFIGLFYQAKNQENELRQTFVDNYNKDRMKREFRLQEMALHLERETLMGNVVNLIHHQAQFHFWSAADETLHPAFLLSDTDDDRDEPYDSSICTSIKCDSDEFLTAGVSKFMTKTTETLVATLLQLQAIPLERKAPHSTTKDPGNVGGHTTSITTAAILLMIMSNLLFR